MRKKSIIMSGEMVRALLDGRKTQTRRVMNPQPVFRSGNRTIPNWWEFKNCTWSDGLQPFGIENHAPYQPGDVLWVKEVYALHLDGKTVFYRADDEKKYETDGKWQSPIHMPQWASRINLEVAGVKVERLDDITEEDARAEGIVDGGCWNCGESEPCGCEKPEPDAFSQFYLRNKLYCKHHDHMLYLYGNPWLWVYSFREI